MLYVYGIVKAGSSPPDAPGLHDEPVQVIEHGSLAALASPVDEAFDLDSADAERHLDVLIAALRHGPVLPVRLGTVVSDAEAVRHEALSDSADLSQRLDALDGLVELHVDAEDDESESIASLLSARSVQGLGGSFEQRIEVGQQVADALMQHRRGLAEQVLSALRPRALDDAPRRELSGPEDPVLRWAFLVRRDELGEFDEAVARLRGDMPQLEFTYVGPLPVTHFDPRPATAPGAPADSFGGSGAWGW